MVGSLQLQLNRRLNPLLDALCLVGPLQLQLNRSLHQLLQGIGTVQTELDTNLQKMETHVDDLFRAQAYLTPAEADCKLEQTYNTIVEVDGRLSLMTRNLQSSLLSIRWCPRSGREG